MLKILFVFDLPKSYFLTEQKTVRSLYRQLYTEHVEEIVIRSFIIVNIQAILENGVLKKQRFKNVLMDLIQLISKYFRYRFELLK